jgi:hypothetical protein
LRQGGTGEKAICAALPQGNGTVFSVLIFAHNYQLNAVTILI